MMAPHAIVSYDDTQNDHDALMLGRILRRCRREADARVRASRQSHAAPDEEQLSQHEADALLERGARWLEDDSTSSGAW